VISRDVEVPGPAPGGQDRHTDDSRNDVLAAQEALSGVRQLITGGSPR